MIFWLDMFLIATGSAAVLYFWADANWWRVEAYLEGRRIDRLVREQERRGR